MLEIRILAIAPKWVFGGPILLEHVFLCRIGLFVPILSFLVALVFLSLFCLSWSHWSFCPYFVFLGRIGLFVPILSFFVLLISFPYFGYFVLSSFLRLFFISFYFVGSYFVFLFYAIFSWDIRINVSLFLTINHMNFVHCYFLQQYFYDPSLYSIHYSLFPLLSIFVYSVFIEQIFSLCYFDLLFSHVFSIIILVFIRSFIQILYFVMSHLYILATNAIEYGLSYPFRVFLCL